MSKLRLVVFASGRGSNFQAIANSIAEKKLSAQILALITNAVDAGCIQIARSFDIPVHVIPSRIPGKNLTRAEHEAQIYDVLRTYEFDWIVLAGYMRLLSADFVVRYPNIINIHPSLLPNYPGIDAYAQALADGASETGATVHRVTSEMDAGPIMAQSKIQIRSDDTVESLMQRGLRNEHALYVSTLQELSTRVHGRDRCK